MEKLIGLTCLGVCVYITCYTMYIMSNAYAVIHSMLSSIMI